MNCGFLNDFFATLGCKKKKNVVLLPHVLGLGAKRSSTTLSRALHGHNFSRVSPPPGELRLGKGHGFCFPLKLWNFCHLKESHLFLVCPYSSGTHQHTCSHHFSSHMSPPNPPVQRVLLVQRAGELSHHSLSSLCLCWDDFSTLQGDTFFPLALLLLLSFPWKRGQRINGQKVQGKNTGEKTVIIISKNLILPRMQQPEDL